MNAVRRWWRVAVIIAAGVTAYGNSFGGVFLFDDMPSILSNPAVTDPIATWPAVLGGNRPVAIITLAANYAAGGTTPWGYHLMNLTIHLLAGLVLFDLIRRALQLPRCGGLPPVRAADLAVAIATLWVVHPLTTQAVTYIVQRMESLMALFYLFTLYAAVRGAPDPSRTPNRWWSVAAVGCCGLGMLTKEVMVTAPVAAVLLDRAILSGTFRAALVRRWGMYLGLAATWLLLTSHVSFAFTGNETPVIKRSAGFAAPGPTPWEYARSEPGVILQYLRLALWPDPLCLDYWWPVAPAVQVIPAVVIGTWVALVGLAWRRRPAVGWLLGFPLLVLAPTSSIMPIRDLAVEHRMYLPLAALVALGVLSAGALLQRLRRQSAAPRWPIGALLTTTASIIYICITIAQNSYYASEESMWRRVIAIRPSNPRPYVACGKIKFDRGEFAEALPLYSGAVRADPNYADGHSRLGLALMKSGDGSPEPNFREAIRLEPNDPLYHNNLGVYLMDTGRPAEAEAVFRNAIEVDPAFTMGHLHLAMALARQGNLPEAEAQFRRTLRLDPQSGEALYNLAMVLDGLNRKVESADVLEQAVDAEPVRRFVAAQIFFRLGDELAAAGQPAAAVRCFERGLRTVPDDGPALNGMGVELGKINKFSESEWTLRRAISLNPKSAESRYNLGITLLRARRPGEAVRFFEDATQLAPDVVQYKQGLDFARSQIGPRKG